MERDLGRAVLMRRRTRSFGVLLVGALLAVALVGTGGSPASADPATPAPTPTPSVSPPSQQQIDDAKAALERLRGQGHAGHSRPSTRLTQVAGPTADGASAGVTSRISDQAWWTMAAAVLVLVVASETTRIRVRRAKHRKA